MGSLQLLAHGFDPSVSHKHRVAWYEDRSNESDSEYPLQDDQFSGTKQLEGYGVSKAEAHAAMNILLPEMLKPHSAKDLDADVCIEEDFDDGEDVEVVEDEEDEEEVDEEDEREQQLAGEQMRGDHIFNTSDFRWDVNDDELRRYEKKKSESPEVEKAIALAESTGRRVSKYRLVLTKAKTQLGEETDSEENEPFLNVPSDEEAKALFRERMGGEEDHDEPGTLPPPIFNREASPPNSYSFCGVCNMGEGGGLSFLSDVGEMILNLFSW